MWSTCFKSCLYGYCSLPMSHFITSRISIRPLCASLLVTAIYTFILSALPTLFSSSVPIAPSEKPRCLNLSKSDLFWLSLERKSILLRFARSFKFWDKLNSVSSWYLISSLSWVYWLSPLSMFSFNSSSSCYALSLNCLSSNSNLFLFSLSSFSMSVSAFKSSCMPIISLLNSLVYSVSTSMLALSCSTSN